MAKVNKIVRGRGRPAFDESNKGVAALLKSVSEGKEVSRFLILKLVAKGLVDAVPVQSGKRGRPAIDYKVSGKGRGFLGLARSWSW